MYHLVIKPLVVAVAMAAGGAFAAQEQVMARVDVIGTADNLLVLPGSATTVKQEELEGSRVLTVNEALRKVAGVNVRDEEGFGLRPNIAIRGLNPTRSTKVTLLEDGIPLAYAPYGDNASYYHPSIDRYQSIEVLKGAGIMAFGPQTIGGVVNYITRTPPQKPGGHVQVTAGNRDYANAQVSLGGHGMLLDYTRKQGDGARDNMNHQINDLNLKLVRSLGDHDSLALRFNYYNEDSQLTYSGLTQAEFEKLGARYNPFKNDNFKAERVGLSATHDHDFGNGALLTTNYYFSYFSRDWWRQASTTTDSQCGAAFTTARNNGLQVNPDACDSIQGRLRDYTTYGIEPRFVKTHGLGEFQAGVKAHVERQDRRQVNAKPVTNGAATTSEDQVRDTQALSVFVSNRFDLGQFSVTPIVRHERIASKRTNKLTGAEGEALEHKATAGVGGTWNPSRNTTVFTSVHQGYAPQRVEDLIGGTGTVVDVNPEKSVNFEFGVRQQVGSSSRVQAAYFRNDFDNLIAVGSIAGGSTPLAEGKALFEGLELSAATEQENGFFGRVAATWLPTAEQTSAFRRVDNGMPSNGSVAGKRQPYAPRQTFTVASGYQKGKWRSEVELQHVGEQFSDFANTDAPAVSGQTGIIKAYSVVNTAVNYQVEKALTAFLAVKNLGDNTYIVDRTRGIQVGMPRLVQVGLRYSF